MTKTSWMAPPPGHFCPPMSGYDAPSEGQRDSNRQLLSRHKTMRAPRLSLRGLAAQAVANQT